MSELAVTTSVGTVILGAVGNAYVAFGEMSQGGIPGVFCNFTYCTRRIGNLFGLVWPFWNSLRRFEDVVHLLKHQHKIRDDTAQFAAMELINRAVLLAHRLLVEAEDVLHEMLDCVLSGKGRFSELVAILPVSQIEKRVRANAVCAMGKVFQKKAREARCNRQKFTLGRHHQK